jgi:hypothetical protein
MLEAAEEARAQARRAATEQARREAEEEKQRQAAAALEEEVERRVMVQLAAIQAQVCGKRYAVCCFGWRVDRDGWVAGAAAAGVL